MFRLNFGNNLFFQKVLDQIIDIGSGGMRYKSNEILLPKKCNGPFISKNSVQIANEILEKLHTLPVNDRNRILRSLEIFEEGSENIHNFRFMCIWISIEILCKTWKPVTIYKQLEKAYEKNRSYVVNILLAEKLYDIRGACFHKGKNIKLLQSLERYMQCLYLDLLRYHMELEPLYYMKEMLDRKEIDSSVFNNDFIVKEIKL